MLCVTFALFFVGGSKSMTSSSLLGSPARYAKYTNFFNDTLKLKRVKEALRIQECFQLCTIVYTHIKCNINMYINIVCVCVCVCMCV